MNSSLKKNESICLGVRVQNTWSGKATVPELPLLPDQ